MTAKPSLLDCFPIPEALSFQPGCLAVPSISCQALLSATFGKTGQSHSFLTLLRITSEALSFDSQLVWMASSTHNTSATCPQSGPSLSAYFYGFS